MAVCVAQKKHDNLVLLLLKNSLKKCYNELAGMLISAIIIQAERQLVGEATET